MGQKHKPCHVSDLLVIAACDWVKDDRADMVGQTDSFRSDGGCCARSRSVVGRVARRADKDSNGAIVKGGTSCKLDLLVLFSNSLFHERMKRMK